MPAMFSPCHVLANLSLGCSWTEGLDVTRLLDALCISGEESLRCEGGSWTGALASALRLVLTNEAEPFWGIATLLSFSPLWVQVYF